MDQQTFKIWFAGFYEGEGSISNDVSNRNRIRICVSQNDPTPLNMAKEIWGGYIRKRVRKSPASDKICTGHEWVMNHCDSLKFIEDIKPYMIIPYKINQMNVVIENTKKEWVKNSKCSFCDIIFSDRPNARRHELKEHINKGEMFKCDLCGTEYKSKDSLSRHNKLKHKSDASDE